VVDSVLQESTNSLSSKTTLLGVGCEAKFVIVVHASMVTSKSMEKKISFWVFIFAPVKIKVEWT
jgi:hypothetical protein